MQVRGNEERAGKILMSKILDYGGCSFCVVSADTPIPYTRTKTRCSTKSLSLKKYAVLYKYERFTILTGKNMASKFEKFTPEDADFCVYILEKSFLALKLPPEEDKPNV